MNTECDAEGTTSVYSLITKLCNTWAEKNCESVNISRNKIVRKMRARSFEVMLTRSLPNSKTHPLSELLSHYYYLKTRIKNVAEYRKTKELKYIIELLREMNGKDEDLLQSMLKVLISLKETTNKNLTVEMFEEPFTFGLLDQMLPRPPPEMFGSPQPYAFYPNYIFELPYSVTSKPESNNDFTIEHFESKLFLPDTTTSSQIESLCDTPLSIASLHSTRLSLYKDSSTIQFPRLTAPRDLVIPCKKDSNIFPKPAILDSQSHITGELKEKVDDHSMDIWELATHIDKNIPDNIWELVGQMSPLIERQLIASCSREVCLWRDQYEETMHHLRIITEKQFIRHLMYLTIGIETVSFPYNKETECFCMRENLVLEGISKECIQGYVSKLVILGTYYKRLFDFAFNQNLNDHCHTNGLIFEASRESVQRYLLDFRLKATSMYEGCFSGNYEQLNCMPTLLHILYKLEPLKYEIETIATIYKVTSSRPAISIPRGAELMSYLFNEISLITHMPTSLTMFNSLFSICKVYFKFIERFIFEGELDDTFREFFIRKDGQYVNCSSKLYWDKGFYITQSVAIPDFLKDLAKCILLCGKSLRLLKLCNPNDPLVVLISSDHPSVKCCSSFNELEQQQQMLEVYRTRCLFVSGEPVTFEQILLKREAERKAFAEMASMKHAETLEKIMAERKRLAQLILAEKQHSIKVLEAAIAEAQAAKDKAKAREKLRSHMEHAVEESREEVDSILRNEEKNKIMEYYSKLNMQVEKSKIHTEWKIKRLQLDESRIQLLSTEERNLKREKLELEHQKNEENMAMSIQSFGDNFEVEEEDKEVKSTDNINNFSEESSEANTVKESSTVFNVVYNVARSIFGGSRKNKDEDVNCDNQLRLDPEGNVIEDNVEINCNTDEDFVDADDGTNINDNDEYLKNKSDAIRNKEKSMSHNYFEKDTENNSITPTVNVIDIDKENNIKMNTAFDEAKRNKMKVLGEEFYQSEVENVPKKNEPQTDAQRQALINKQKVLGVEYNLALPAYKNKEPLNVAQEEAIRNRNKVLGTEDDYNPVQTTCKQAAKRSGLTLNLNSFDRNINLKEGTTPGTGGVTPGEFYKQLELETPTAEVPFDRQIDNGSLTSPNNINNDKQIASNNKTFWTTEGFNFPTYAEDDGSADSSDFKSFSNQSSPNKSDVKQSVWNSQDELNRSDDFDPFGVNHIKLFSSNLSNCSNQFHYSDPADVMREVKLKPYCNIFRFLNKDEDEQMITCDNIATLTACLQRSVMLPLTYQLEVVNNSILTYFLVNQDMYEHLRSLKDYFFLMDGEFSKSICQNIFDKLVKTINPQELLNFATLHNILDKALGSSISHIHKFSENLSFTISDVPLSFHHSSPDVLQCLSLTYTVGWPLNIILSQEALVRYAKVFQFLLKMRRISWVLGKDFEALKLEVKLSGTKSRTLLRSPQYRSIQTYRHIMASLIRAIDNYIVTTCILTSWTEFESDLKRATTLDDLYDCHVAYIKKVLFRCLLNNRSTPVMKILNDIFKVILSFSRVLKAGEWQQSQTGEFVHQRFGELREIFLLSQRLANQLQRVATKLVNCGYQRPLADLLALASLNQYYEKPIK